MRVISIQEYVGKGIQDGGKEDAVYGVGTARRRRPAVQLV